MMHKPKKKVLNYAEISLNTLLFLFKKLFLKPAIEIKLII